MEYSAFYCRISVQNSHNSFFYCQPCMALNGHLSTTCLSQTLTLLYTNRLIVEILTVQVCMLLTPAHLHGSL